MIRGQISCTWDQKFVEEIDFTLQKYSTVGKEPNQLSLLDPDDITRYDIGSWIARDFDIKDFPWITENFWWLENKIFQINLFKPGMIGPLHTDHYNYYCAKYNINDESKLQRIIIFLQDWKSGHYFEVDNIGIVNWSAGDWVGFDLNEPHALANIGLENRYTLQITGTKKH